MNQPNIKKRTANSIGYCCAATCYNTTKLVPEISYFCFPKDKKRFRIWMLNCRRKDLISLGDSQDYVKNRYIKLCAEHFEPSQFMNYKCRSLISTAIPTIFYEDEVKPRIKARIDEYEKQHPNESLNLVEQCDYIKTAKPSKEIRIKRFIDAVPPTSIIERSQSSSQSNSQNLRQPVSLINSISLNSLPNQKYNTQSQTTITIEDMNRVDRQCEEVNTMLGVLNEQLVENSVNSGMGQKFLQENPASVPFYTGFSDYSSLMKFYDKFQPHIESHYKLKLSKFQEMILFLSRLRLNMPFEDLVFRYSLSKVLVFHVYKKWLHVMCELSNNYVKIPERKEWAGIYQPVFLDSLEKLHLKINDFTVVKISQQCKSKKQNKHPNEVAMEDHSYTVVNKGSSIEAPNLVKDNPHGGEISHLENPSNKRKDQGDKNSQNNAYKHLRVEPSQNILVILLEIREIIFKESDLDDEYTLLLSERYNLPTFKFLVALSSAGKIIYASKTYYGSTKNSFILENCGLLKLLQAGDILLSKSIFCECPSYKFTCAELSTVDDKYVIKYYNPREIEKLKDLEKLVESKFSRIRNKYAVLRDQVVIDIEDLFKNDLPSKLEGVSHMIKVSCILTNFVNSNFIG